MELEPNALLSEAGRIYGLIGPVGAVLVVLSIVSLALILLKVMALLATRRGAAKPIEAALAALEGGEGREVARTLAALGRSRHPVAVLVRAGAGLVREGAGRAQTEARVRALAQHEFARLKRHNGLLELIGLIAPLLGLLGTILGMIEAFQALQTSGSEADPAILAGGIWEALLTTALGLVVAIPAIVAFHLAESRSERLRAEASVALGRLFAALGEGVREEDSAKARKTESAPRQRREAAA